MKEGESLNKKIKKIVYILAMIMIFVCSFKYLPRISEKATMKFYKIINKIGM